jgi:hypothetical protein
VIQDAANVIVDTRIRKFTAAGMEKFSRDPRKATGRMDALIAGRAIGQRKRQLAAG